MGSALGGLHSKYYFPYNSKIFAFLLSYSSIKVRQNSNATTTPKPKNSNLVLQRSFSPKRVGYAKETTNYTVSQVHLSFGQTLVLVPDPKPTPARIASACYTGSYICAG